MTTDSSTNSIVIFDRPSIPVNIKSNLYSFFKELFLKPGEVEKLHDFEEECVEDYWREKQRDERKQSELQLDNISSRLVLFHIVPSYKHH